MKSLEHQDVAHALKTDMPSNPLNPSSLWPDSYWQKIGNASEPVIISSVGSGNVEDAVDFLNYSTMQDRR